MLAAGFPVIVDAAALARSQRDLFRDLAQARQVPFAIIACSAGADSLRARLQRRAAAGGDASDADVAVLEQQMRSQQPIDACEAAHTFLIDTTEDALPGAPPGSVRELLQQLAASGIAAPSPRGSDHA